MMMRDLVQPGEPYWLPRGQVPPCGFTINLETREKCGAEPAYVLHFKTWDANSTACVRHGAMVRTRPELEWIRSI